jgi:hypothetical protein
MTDPFSITVGTLSILGASAKAVQTIDGLHSDYRNAGKEVLHARAQHVLLRENIRLAKALNTSLQSRSKISASQLALETIEEDLPTTLRSDRKRDRIRWVLKEKRKFREQASQLQETGVSTILALQLQALYVHAWTDVLFRLQPNCNY